MFGMQDKKDKEKKVNDQPYQIETKLDDTLEYKKLLNKIEDRVNSLKNALRKGADKEDFDKLGVVLQGYVAMQKVIKKAHDKK